MGLQDNVGGGPPFKVHPETRDQGSSKPSYRYVAEQKYSTALCSFRNQQC